MQKIVSIVIPVYNQLEYLKDAIESAINQTVKCNIIVVNDGSTDGLSELIDYLIVKYSDVVFISKENGGLSSARNAGIKEATGEWILTLDSDDKIAPDFVEKCLKYKDEYDIIGTGQQEFGDTDRKYLFKTNPTHADFLQNNQINCCSLFRKEIWEKVGGYEERIKIGLEDWQFWLKATYLGYKVTTVPEYLFFYRKHGDSMISNVHRNLNEAYGTMMNLYLEFKQSYDNRTTNNPR